jgi:hypothetical protein
LLNSAHGYFLNDQQVQMNNDGAAPGAAALEEDPMLRSGLYLAGADRALATPRLPASTTES